MELIAGPVFIGAAIIAVVQFIKYVAPRITGPLTIVAAVLVGILVALVDTHIGVQDVSVGSGIMIALAAVGTVTTAAKLGRDTSPPKV